MLRGTSRGRNIYDHLRVDVTPGTTMNSAVADNAAVVVLTEEEYEALQDSRFAELPALLVGDLRHALESATPDTRMGCLLRNLLPYLRKPQVPAEVIALVYEGIDEVRDAMAAVPLSGRMSDERQEVDRRALAGFRLAVQSYNTCVEALLEFSLLRNELGLPQPECDEEASGSAPAPEGEPPRVLRWEGYAEPGPDEGRDVIVRIHCDSIAARRFCGTGKIVHVESAAEAPAPDFAAMSPDELRAWLDERGRRWTWNSRSCEWAARLDGNDFNSTIIARTVDHPSEPAALLALCQKVAAEEAS